MLSLDILTLHVATELTPLSLHTLHDQATRFTASEYPCVIGLAKVVA